MERLVVEIRPVAQDELGFLERKIGFDWAALGKHRERFARQQEGKVVYLVAWLGNLPVGHVLVKREGTTDDPTLSQLGDCPNLEDLFVAPAHRSRGVGSQLLDASEALAKRQGFSRIGLGVAVDNPRARMLYELRGYEDAGFGEYTTGGHYVDRDGQEKTWEEVCRYLIKQLETTEGQGR